MNISVSKIVQSPLYLIFASLLFPHFRSSSVPKKVDILEGMHVLRYIFLFIFGIRIFTMRIVGTSGTLKIYFPSSVACGLGFSMVVVDRTNVANRLDQVTSPRTRIISVIFLDVPLSDPVAFLVFILSLNVALDSFILEP